VDWLEIARNQAEERFRSLPFPGQKDENYRFTPVAYPVKSSPVAETEALPSNLLEGDAGESALLALKGEEVVARTGELPGIQFTDLERALMMGSDWLKSRLRENELFRDDKFAQLTSSRWKNGALVHIPAGARPVQPLRFLTAPAAAEEHYRHLIVLEEGAEAVVVQESWSDGAERFVGELLDLRLGRNSRLHWVVLQNLGASTEAWLRQRVELAAGAELKVTALHLGGKLLQLRQEVHLSGERSSLSAQVAARGDFNQHFDFWMDVRHEGSRTLSGMDFWFVMADRARAIFNGQVDVAGGALECESSQKAKSLLLGEKATVHAIPKLLIRTDAVKASHGASVSSVSPEQLHYLQSRGIPRAEAESMIVRGFTEPVLARLPGEALQARAERGLDLKHGGGSSQ
jgi:Fe-S cluster assembly protein SufD